MGDLSSREGSLSFRAEGVARVGKPSYHGLREGWEGVGKKGKQGRSVRTATEHGHQRAQPSGLWLPRPLPLAVPNGQPLPVLV